MVTVDIFEFAESLECYFVCNLVPQGVNCTRRGWLYFGMRGISRLLERGSVGRSTK